MIEKLILWLLPKEVRDLDKGNKVDEAERRALLARQRAIQVRYDLLSVRREARRNR